DEAQVAPRAAFQQPAQRRRLRLRRTGGGLLDPGVLVGGRGGGRLAHVLLPFITRSSTLASSSSSAGAVCTTRPSRTTSTRWASPSTSGTSLDTSRIAAPSAASRCTRP